MNALTGLERGFGWLLQTTWQAAVVTVIILLVQFLLRRRLSPAWRHGLWFLLVARLLMPMTPSSAVSVFNLANWSRRQAARVSVQAPAAEALDLASSVVFARPEKPEVQSAAPPSALTRQIPEPIATKPFPPARASQPARPAAHPLNLDWMGVAALVWLAGVLVLVSRLVYLERRFGFRIADAKPASDETVSRLFNECARSLRVREKVRIIETAEVDSPAVYGLRRKRLLLPIGLREELSADELRHVLLHELAHIKRRDPELNWLLVILHILHWFNPVLWFAFARVRADRELATDDLALAQTEQRERVSYGETILKVLEGLSPRGLLPGLVGIGESKAEMRERIRAIARGGSVRRWRWAACAAAVLIAGVALTNAREENHHKGVNLLERYPTSLKTGDATPGRARPWQFAPEDIFAVSGFTLEVGKPFRVETGAAELGIGHCADGAVWAVLIPHEDGKLTSTVATNQEAIVNVWLRFHPAQINFIFPPETVTGAGSAQAEERIRAVVEDKFHSSWHAGNNALIPEPKDLTVDLDTKDGPRRFFMVDKDAQTAEYVAGFARQRVGAAELAYEPEVDTNCARVISVVPPVGAKEVEATQDLQIGFDRPMNPYVLKLEWLAGGFQLNGSIQVSADRKQFIIPVRLAAGQEQKLVVNRDSERELWQAMGRQPGAKASGSSRKGFLDADGLVANEFRWSFRTKAAAEKPDAGKPRVISASPASGATTPVLTMVEITFDQPMRPPDAMFPYLQKRPFAEGPSLIPNFEYDSAAHRFTFPALLPPDNDARLTIKGFYSADGVACDPVVLHYQTATESLGRSYTEKAKAAAKDARLGKLLSSMKDARARLNSGGLTVQTVRLGMSQNSFNNIDAQTATFKWQGSDQVYADITGPMQMCKAFILGSDVRMCWLYSEDDKGKKRLDQTPATKTEREIALLDPFDLTGRPIAEALEQRGLVLANNATLEGRSCYRIETWDVRQDNFAYATETQWWIDEETYLPTQIVQDHPNGSEITRFVYKDLNQHLPDSAFQPPAEPGADAAPLFFQKEPGPDERRFLRISDGSNGRMSGRLGWNGPGGTTSSGMN
ncbi:MAG: M56 family metallopeptidase [Limisphaerales bacterium]